MDIGLTTEVQTFSFVGEDVGFIINYNLVAETKSCTTSFTSIECQVYYHIETETTYLEIESCLVEFKLPRKRICMYCNPASFRIRYSQINFTDYYAVMVQTFTTSINGIKRILPVNERYRTSDIDIEIVEDGTIAIYHRVWYDSVSIVLVPEDYCVIVEEKIMQQDKSMMERFVRERTDPTISYQDMYRKEFGMQLNMYCDVNRNDYQK